MKQAKYSALTIANYIIRYSIRKNYSISNLRLQKLLYFVQVQALVDAKRPCFKESIIAWSFGPVVPSVYEEYKFFGSNDINVIHNETDKVIADDDKKRINTVVDSCKSFSDSSLIAFTLAQTPWVKAYQAGKDKPIPNESIYRFFKD